MQRIKNWAKFNEKPFRVLDEVPKKGEYFIFNDDGRRGLIISTKGERVYYISTKQGSEFTSFNDSEVISLVNGNKVRTIKSAYSRGINFNSSDLLVADYKESIVYRSEGQIESFNFILSF